MKKTLLILVLVFLGFNSGYAQGDLKLGFNAGIPTGDMGDHTNLQAGADMAYLLGFAGLVELGPLVGFSRFLGEDDLDDIQFIPIAASGRIDLAMLVVGLDLGYAVALDDGMDGGLYYRPKVGFGLGPLNLFISYAGISTNGTNASDLSSINAGIELSL